LLVGGIGIMNIMLVSVAERTKEIGIRKALGASPSVIRGQFIVEALTLTLVGGILGIIFGCILSYAVVNIAGWTLKLSYNSFIIAVGFSMIVGIFFGWYPAMMASRLDPIEALNYE
jgi:putative ABC transport system permease protein